MLHQMRRWQSGTLIIINVMTSPRRAQQSQVPEHILATHKETDTFLNC